MAAPQAAQVAINQPPLPGPLPAADVDPVKERDALTAKRQELEAYLVALAAHDQLMSERLAAAEARANVLYAENMQREREAQQLEERERLARQQLTERLKGVMGPSLDTVFRLAEHAARLEDYFTRHPRPADAPRIPAQVEPKEAETILANLLLARKTTLLEANLAMLEQKAADRYGVVVSRALSDLSGGAQGQIVMVNPEAMFVDNERLTRLNNEYLYSAELARQQLANAQRELTEAHQRLNTIDANNAALVNGLAEQFSQLAKLQYVQVGNVQSPEQVRLICLAGDSKRRQLDSQARALSGSLSGLVQNRSATFTILRQLAHVQGGQEAPGSVQDQRLCLKFSNAADVNSFREYAAPSGATIYTTTITPVAIVVNVTW